MAEQTLLPAVLPDERDFGSDCTRATFQVGGHPGTYTSPQKGGLQRNSPKNRKAISDSMWMTRLASVGLVPRLSCGTWSSPKKYADALRAEGLNAGTAYNEGFPDRHIYTYWDSILFKHSPDASGYPWKDPRYKGDVEYSRDMCPQTLSILGRALTVRLQCKYAGRATHG